MFKAMFQAAKAPFQDALVRAGYDHQLVFSPTNQPSRRRRRRRNILLFNPPFCKSVKTNLGRLNGKFHFKFPFCFSEYLS